MYWPGKTALAHIPTTEAVKGGGESKRNGCIFSSVNLYIYGKQFQEFPEGARDLVLDPR